MTLTPEQADSFLELICSHVQRPYPWSPGHLVDGPQLLAAEELHPAFHGSLDWHSCVHSHWALVRLSGRFPDARHAAAARTFLDDDLTGPKLAAELAYVQEHPTFERPYGWAWLLQLAVEISESGRHDWEEALRPLASHVRASLIDYLEALRRPVRIGLHGNTAFAAQLALDYAERARDAELSATCRDRAMRWFASDRDYPAHLEPLGSDFLSGAVTEAALMARVLEPDRFAAWYADFLPEVESGTVLKGVDAGDDAHLYGFDLSRGWSIGVIAGGLPPRDPRRDHLLTARNELLAAGLPRVGNGDYMADHWLASFAMLALDL